MQENHNPLEEDTLAHNFTPAHNLLNYFQHHFQTLEFEITQFHSLDKLIFIFPE